MHQHRNGISIRDDTFEYPPARIKIPVSDSKDHTKLAGRAFRPSRCVFPYNVGPAVDIVDEPGELVTTEPDEVPQYRPECR